MHNKTTLLAFDFGASSGRLIKATFEQDTLSYQEVHRFENTPIQENGHLCWDFETLLKEVHTGIEKAGDFDSIAFDTWGVDVGLLDKDGNLIQNPFHYRDSITQNAIEELTQIVDAKTLYALTGNQILSFNT